MVAVRTQAHALRHTDHRPWPLPRAPWVMAQTWEDLLFAHWPVPVERLRAVVPREMPLDTHAGSAWLGITPFDVSALRLRGLPHVPGITTFLETNVRTYATIGGRPGIHFFSLDAASCLAVLGARLTYRLPYFRARMAARREAGWVDYRTVRASSNAPAARLHARYRPTGPAFNAVEGTLEHFLTERYCLYAVDRPGRVLRADIHHRPWPLQAAEAELERNTMAEPVGLALDGAPLLHFAARQDVLIWPPAPVRDRRR
jgi:uncharacterized protein YqjF (DUF2071 family)